jgi:hypothetical protein
VRVGVLTVIPILQTETFTRNLPLPSLGQLYRTDGCTMSVWNVGISLKNYKTSFIPHQKRAALFKWHMSCMAWEGLNKSRTNQNEIIKYSSMLKFHASLTPQSAVVVTQIYTSVFWDVTSSRLVDVYRRFRRRCYLHQGWQTSVHFYQTTRRHNPQYRTLHHRKNLKSHRYVFRTTWFDPRQAECQPPPITKKRSTSLWTSF